MSITIIARNGFTATGELAGFDEGSAQLTFKFKGGTSIEIPSPSNSMLASLMHVGLAMLANSEVNFVTNQVKIKDKTSMVGGGAQPMTSVGIGTAR